MTVQFGDGQIPPINNYEMNKAVTFSHLFSRVKLSPGSKLILRCLIDFWNVDIGYVYPKQKTIAKCTGLSEISVINSVEELRKAGLILTVKENGRLKYYFTQTFFSLLELSVQNTLARNITNFRQTHKESLGVYKQIKKTDLKNKTAFSKNNNQGIKYPSIESTQKLLEEYRNSRDEVSPYTDLQCALNWLQSIPKNLQNDPHFRLHIEKVKSIWNL